MKIFSKKDFKVMNWSNGGGITTELYSLQVPFVFRLSVANVDQDGDFSIFPMVDRTLLLLQGNGFNLRLPDHTLQLNTTYSPIQFSGETDIYCSLINGGCIDFNIMIDRRWGKCKAKIIQRKKNILIGANDMMKFIFDFNAFQLWQIEGDDQVSFEQDTNSTLVIVEVYAH